MNFNAKDIIEFLIPELQIIKAIKENGFIAKSNKNRVNNRKSNLNQSYSGDGYTYTYESYTSYNTRNSNNNDGYQENNVFSRKSSINKNTNAPEYKYQNTSNMNFTKSKVNSNTISKYIDEMREELKNEIIGQRNYIDNLCIGFKRPFVAGCDLLKPKNVMVLLGNKGTGKHLSIITSAKILKEKKLINSSEVLSIDLSLYSTPENFNLFLSDLYKCLYGKGDILVFDNFNKCHSSILNFIETLVSKGKCILNSRYVFQNNNLIEATGMLLQNSISEIECNNKYFIFTAENSSNKTLDVFSSNFKSCIGDIIITEDFSYGELTQLTIKSIENFKNKCMNNLLIEISYDESFVNFIISNYNKNIGVQNIGDSLEQKVYKPLTELKLNNKLKNNQKVLLCFDNNRLIAKTSNEIIDLCNVIGNKDYAGLEEIKKELQSIVGIKSVKDYVLSLEDNLKIQKMRRNAGFEATDITMHMIFTGNPGSGKTTIARIVAKYLKSLGILSSGHLREVTRADLVGQYVGQTAKLTTDVIKSALGGVLFIDEAYSLCRDKNDIFGIEAIDALVKGIEDNRNDLVVILAGYKDEMDEFLKTNSGLKSRFPNIIEFEDYTPAEMYEISIITANSKGYRINEDCQEPLIKLYEKKQIKGKNDSGNGRLVRNIIESAILNQSKRLIKNPTDEIDILKFEDFNFEDNKNFNLEESLSKIIGLEEVKDFVRTQYNLLIAQEKRKKAGISVDASQALNMIFTGNPGTGKTTVARLVAEMFKEMGVLKSGQLIETDKSGLVAEYAGQTAKKTEEIFKSALGGVLFIDEAYSLDENGSGFGKEAIDTLVKLIEDYRGEIVVILAGYKKEMGDFLKTNSGLQSRFPLNIHFKDYSLEDLFKITLKMIKDKGFVLEENLEGILKEQINILHKQSNEYSGNGRMIRNYLEEIMRKQSTRIAINDVPVDKMNMIIREDIEEEINNSNNFNLEDELSKIIGLGEVKNYIRSLSARLRLQSERKKLGLPVDSTQTLHMIFKGNPGTGKTMVARTVAEVLYNIRVIKTNKLVETDRASLVAGYVGQTAIKTKEKFMEALDGVLFIDEAYALSQGGGNDFGKEAIDTLVKLMDDYRDRIVVILAGYSNDMDNFLEVNSGLKSRFPNIIEFKDYNTDELMEICENLYRSKGYEIDKTAKNKLYSIFNEVKNDSSFGNGRYVRNLYEKSINNQSMRLSTDMDLTKEELITITNSDIERV